MKIVVIGGSGLIGKGVVKILQDHGHDVFAASPSSGVNTVTGEGLADAFANTDVVVDVANSPSFADADVMEFFKVAGRNIAAAEIGAGVKHHVALSVVGADRITDSGYMRAKDAQERIIREAGIPYTILRATQFMEFLAPIAGTAETVKLTGALIQPIAASDVSAAVADVALKAPINGMIEIGGPEKLPMYQAVERALRAKGDTREITRDDEARYFGARLETRTLVAQDDARVAPITLQEWLGR